MNRSRHLLITGVLLGALGAGLAGCGTTAADLPLPGTSMRGETYQVSATFDDALNLAQGASVKVDGVVVGRVVAIGVEDLRAVVTMDIAADTPISRTADFRLRTTTALGELFVDVVEDPAAVAADRATLQDGDRVDPDRSSAAPTVEDTLSAASLFINGGGLSQIQTIVDETNLAIGGREDTVRDVLHRITSTASSVADMSAEIDAALVAVADASGVLAARQSTIDRALTEIAPAAEVLDQNTAALVDLLTSVDALGDVVVPTIAQTRDDIVAIAAQAGPIFAEVASVESRLDAGVERILAFVAGLQAGVPGSFLNTHLTFRGALSLGDLTVVAPSGDGSPLPEVAPDLVQDLTQLPLISQLTGLLPAPASGSSAAGPPTGGNPLADLLAPLGGGAS
ncbi:MlaD family protein [Aeromicrobium sp.]|uniref:MlaD family protein n=1 Tax=Aeromicrobium sp. TaxID=1871063 RepID=UPI0025C42E08|nr:MlaD family protein [Aeromicrobium sp.]MCK5892422.1 MCE family protein [Aeromicrobium sp.]